MYDRGTQTCVLLDKRSTGLVPLEMRNELELAQERMVIEQNKQKTRVMVSDARTVLVRQRLTMRFHSFFTYSTLPVEVVQGILKERAIARRL